MFQQQKKTRHFFNLERRNFTYFLLFPSNISGSPIFIYRERFLSEFHRALKFLIINTGQISFIDRDSKYAQVWTITTTCALELLGATLSSYLNILQTAFCPAVCIYLVYCKLKAARFLFTFRVFCKPIKALYVVFK